VFVGHRRVDLYCQGGYGEDGQLPSIVDAINDCHAVLVAKVGHCPKGQLATAGVEPVTEYAFQPIEASLLAWLAQLSRRVAAGEAAPVRRAALHADAIPEVRVA